MNVSVFGELQGVTGAFVLTGCLAMCVGCGGDRGKPILSLKRADPSIELGDYVEVETGRLEAAPPKGWEPRDQRRGYLVKYGPAEPGPWNLPTIQIEVDERLEGLEAFQQELTEENVAEFAKLIDERLKARNQTVLEQVRPMIIGGRLCVRYVRPARFSYPKSRKLDGESQVLETLIDGRLYRVTLHLELDTIVNYRDHAYAVLAGLRVPKPPE